MITLKTGRQVGIIGYGAYVPMYRLQASEINRVWGGFGAPVICPVIVNGLIVLLFSILRELKTCKSAAIVCDPSKTVMGTWFVTVPIVSVPGPLIV